MSDHTDDYNEYDAVLQILIQDIKDAGTAHDKDMAVHTYKAYCEAELTRLTAIGYSWKVIT